MPEVDPSFYDDNLKNIVLYYSLTPDEMEKELHAYAKKLLNEGKVKELIFALSATMEGDTTAYYLYKKFKGFPVTFSTIARGISVGDELEYADEISLGRSIVNRLPYNEKM